MNAEDIHATVREACASLDGATRAALENITSAELVHGAAARVARASFTLAVAAGQLAAIEAAHAERVAAERAALEAEAEHDARLYREDKTSMGEQCPSPEEWAEDAFGETWAHATAPHALDRDAACAVYWDAFMAAVANE